MTGPTTPRETPHEGIQDGSQAGTHEHIHDVIIIGAGPGGSATAHYLARAGLDVLLLDRATFPRDKTCGDALTPRALRVLDEMGLLADVLARGTRQDTVDFFAPNGFTASADVKSRDEQYSYVEIVPRLILDNMILERAIASGARFEGAVRVVNAQREGKTMVVTGERGRTLATFRARMVVVATGASAGLLVRMGLLERVPPVMLTCRAYYEGMSHLEGGVQCRFDGVPLPGYGWVFPLSATRANVGAGIFREGVARLWMPETARVVFDAFIQTPALRRMLDGATRDGPVKGFPIRVDFARAPTYAERVAVVGEAAGLVNPVTGEGIDYALESGKIAARHIADMFAEGNFSLELLRAYDRELRRAYQRLFVMCSRLRLFYCNPMVLNRAIKAASHQSVLRDLYMDIVMENEAVGRGLAPSTLARVAFG